MSVLDLVGMGAVSVVCVGLNVLVVLTQVWPVHCDVFTALTHMGDWLEFEVRLLDSLDAYIASKRER